MAEQDVTNPVSHTPPAAEASPSAGVASAGNGGGRGGGGLPKVNWKVLWPIPVLAVSTVLLAMALVTGLKNRPKADPREPLHKAEALVEKGDYDEAIDVLNTEPLAHLRSGEADDAYERDFRLIRAEAFAEGQAEHGISVPANHRIIVEDYQEAAKLGAHLGASEISRLVMSLLALDEVDDAMREVSALGESDRETRIRLIRAVIDHNLASPNMRRDLTLRLLTELSTDNSLSDEDRAWTLARQCDLLLAEGDAEGAVNKLLTRLGRIGDVSQRTTAELHLLLGRAYFRLEEWNNAAKNLRIAEDRFEEDDPRSGIASVLLARVQMQNEETREEARERLLEIVEHAAASPARLPAMLSLAEVEAAEGDMESSIHRYAELTYELTGAHVPGMPGASHGHDADTDEHADMHADAHEDAHGEGHGEEGGAHGDEHAAQAGGAHGHEVRPEVIDAGEGTGIIGAGSISRAEVMRSVMERQREQFGVGNYEAALQLAQIAETLAPGQSTPAEVVLALAQTNRKLGDEAVHTALGEELGRLRIADLDPTTREEVKRLYLTAGDLYRRHASMIAGGDPNDYLESLWQAGVVLDMAGDLTSAAGALTDYVDNAAEDDPRRAEAKFRLGQTYEARGEYATAADYYRGLVEGTGGGAGGGANAGLWGDRAIVPLARCLLSDGDDANDEDGESLLERVVEGRVVSPEAAEYRDALISLGTHYYRTHRQAEAIAELEQAVERYPEDPEILSVRYRLADAYRLSAEQIEQTLKQALPQGEKIRLEDARQERLAQAKAEYARVKEGLENERDGSGHGEGAAGRRLSRTEQVYLRNAYFYVGDCAFELGDYDGAIAYYDDARKQYGQDPSSLVAMMQIVACHVAMGRMQAARAANESARRALARFPDEVWNDPTLQLPMEKKHWERWLDSRTLLDQTASAEEGGR